MCIAFQSAHHGGLMMRILLLALSFVVFATAAQAAAIYNWINLGASTCCEGQIVLSDEAFFSGSANFLIDSEPSGFPLPTDTGGILTVNLQPFGGAGAAFGPDVYSGSNSFSLTVVGDGLSGDFTMNTQGSNLLMSGTSDLWMVDSYINDYGGTDEEGRNCYEERCSGGAGRWQLVSKPVPVPEPASGLLLISFLGVLVTLHRRNAKVSIEPTV